MNKTYFSQRDTRWASKVYTSNNNKAQTIKSSGCGPTSAAMVISSLTNNIVYPDAMAEMFVYNGFRTANSGTSWKAMEWVAAKYNLAFMQTFDYDCVIDCLLNGGMVIASAIGTPTALFSTEGHYIVISGYNDGVFEIMDSNLYNGKYDLAYRKAKAKVDGHFVYVKIDDMVNEIKQYFCYTPRESAITPMDKKAKVVDVSTRLRIRKEPDINSEIVGYLEPNADVRVYSESGNWYNIGKGWVSGTYLAFTEGIINERTPR